MPELPEVETTARGLQSRIVGLRVCAVGSVDWPRMLPQTSLADLQETLIGRRILSVGRKGKYLLIEFEDDRWVSVHRKMSGNLLLRPSGAPLELHTHLEIGFDDGTAVRFIDPRKFGRVYLFHSSVEMTDFLASRLGPDSLLELDPKTFAERLRRRKGRIKSLLLDQAFIAGVGNLYADEALWLARIHPLQTADTLSTRKARELAEAIGNVLSDAIQRRGTSFSDYRDAEDRAGENQDFLNAYGREGQPCPRCGTLLKRILIGQRSSVFCPREQRLVTRRAASGTVTRSGTARPRPAETPRVAIARERRAASSPR
jgi:formamidopyrimidine-DNA glycosylase